MRWCAGCVLAVAARPHYLLLPSLYMEFVYAGDLLRVTFFLSMLAGAAREIDSYWQLRTRPQCPRTAAAAELIAAWKAAVSSGVETSQR